MKLDGPATADQLVTVCEVPARKQLQTTILSNLAAARVRRGVHQHELAQATGMSLSSLKRLEQRAHKAPPLWWYVNCAIALGVELDEVLEEQDRRWHGVGQAPKPPPREWLAERKERGERWWAEYVDEGRRERERRTSRSSH